MKKILLLCIIGLMAGACNKTEDVTPSPTPTHTVVCQLDGFTSFQGSEGKINTFDTDGRITQTTVKQTQGQILTLISTFVYETNGQLKSGTMIVRDESGRQIAAQPQTYTYENGLLTTVESRCGCTQNAVVQRTTLRYNAAKQLVEMTQESPGSPDKYVTAYGYDARGNVLNQTRTLSGVTMGQLTYTYDDAKHPHQLVKGLPLNMLLGFSPWQVNVPLTIKSEFVDEKGQKQTADLKRVDLKTNAKGYTTSVSFGSGLVETYTLKNCD